METDSKEVIIRARVSRACKKQLKEIVKVERASNPDYTLSDAMRTAIAAHPALRGTANARAEAIAAIDEIGAERAARILQRHARA